MASSNVWAALSVKLAPRNNRGLVIFSAEFLVSRPVDSARGNGTVLYEVNNRGYPASVLCPPSSGFTQARAP